MPYPKTIHDINALAMENQAILEGTYGADPSVFGQTSKVPVIVECFDRLKEFAEELEGPMLELLAGCACILYSENFSDKKIEAEAIHFITHPLAS